MTRLQWFELTLFSSTVGTLFAAPVSGSLVLSIKPEAVHPAVVLAAISMLFILTRYATGAAESRLLSTTWFASTVATGAAVLAWIRDGLSLELLVPTPTETALAVGVAGLAAALIQLVDAVLRERAWRPTDWKALAKERFHDPGLPEELAAAQSWLELHRERKARRNPLARMEVDCLWRAEQLWNEFAEREPEFVYALAEEWNRTLELTREPLGSALLTARGGEKFVLRCLWLERALAAASRREPGHRMDSRSEIRHHEIQTSDTRSSLGRQTSGF